MKLKAGWWWRALLATVGIGAFGTTYVGWQVHRTPGGFEEWLGDTLSDVRAAAPFLVEPLDGLRDLVAEQQYRYRRWREGGPGEDRSGSSGMVPGGVEAAAGESMPADAVHPEGKDGMAGECGSSSAPPPAASSMDGPAEGLECGAPGQEVEGAAPDSSQRGGSSQREIENLPRGGRRGPAAAAPTTGKEGLDAVLSPLATGISSRGAIVPAMAVAHPVQVAALPSRTAAEPTPLPGFLPAEPIPWQPVAADDVSWIERAMVPANPEMPKSRVLLIRIDASQTSLRWQPGTLQPWNTSPSRERLEDAAPKPDRSGRIPASLRHRPLLAFGGGFESIHFREYGAIHRGKVVVPLARNIQTIAIYEDGTIRMAPWGSDDLPAAGILEARQNLPPLVRRGRVPDNITQLNTGTLGSRFTKDEHNRRVYQDVHTWRSGLGVTGDAHLVYGFGPHLTPRLLARALIRAGAVEAMQLDINAAYHCAPSLFVPGEEGKLELRALYPELKAGQRFLEGSRKDFFYVAAR